MIDLEFEKLPDTLIVDGKDVPIKTGFRVWLRWGRVLAEYHVASRSVLLEPCAGDWVTPALEFYVSENPCPRTHEGARSLDLAADGDYVVAAFQQAYGIDLTSGDMHWHRFLALLRGLPDDTKLVEIAGYRAWRRDKRSHESIMRGLRDDWALPAKAGQPLSAGAEDFLAKNEQRLKAKLGGEN